MATRGRPKGVETKMVHIRVPVTLHRDLEILQVVTQKSTSDVVRGLLERYVIGHEELLAPLAEHTAIARRIYTQSEIDDYERGCEDFLNEKDKETPPDE